MIFQRNPVGIDRPRAALDSFLRDAGESERKAKQRARVLDYLLTNRPGPADKLLTMPGSSWAFEKDFLGHRPHAYFVGLERSWQIIQDALTHAPGCTRHRAEFSFRRGGRIEGYQGEGWRLLHTRAEGFLLAGRSITGWDNRSDWVKGHKRFTGIWLDFSGPLTVDIYRALMNASAHIDMRLEAAPLAVTMMVGREGAFFRTLRGIACPDVRGATARGLVIEATINENRFREFAADEIFVHQGHKGSHFVTVMGMVRKRAEPLLTLPNRSDPWIA